MFRLFNTKTSFGEESTAIKVLYEMKDIYCEEVNKKFDSEYITNINELKKLNIRAVLDGEIIIVDETGKSNFQLLQHYQNDSDHPMEFRVFDTLSINGEDICQLPLTDRKKLLRL